MADGAIILDTPEQISVYQAIVCKQGLKACKLGRRLNRSYTPKNLMALAARITDKKFKARDYDGAITALEQWIAAQQAVRQEQLAAEPEVPVMQLPQGFIPGDQHTRGF